MHESTYGSKAYVRYKSEDEVTKPPPPPYGYLAHEDCGPSMLGATWATWAIAAIFVALRFWARSRVVNGLGWTDWCILLSLLIAGGMSASVTFGTSVGLGKHIWNVDIVANYEPLMVSFWISVLLYFCSLAMTKISICLLYLTIFTIESTRRATYAVLGLVSVTSVYSIIVICTGCVPLKDYWDIRKAWDDEPPSNCHQIRWYWSCNALMIITDFLIFLVPIRIVGPLRLPRRQKLFVIGIFAVGFIVCIISLIRVIFLYDSDDLKAADMTYSTSKVTYWTALEVHGAIAVACVMTLKPLIVRLFPGFLDPRANNSSGGEAGSPDQATAASSEPPLTVGRRPCRMQRLSWIDVRGGVSEPPPQQQPEQQQQQQQPSSGPGPTTTTMTQTAGDVALSEIPVSGRERYSQFLNPSFPLSSKGRRSTMSHEMTNKTTTTTATTITSYNTTRTSAESLKAISDTTSVSASSYRGEEEEDLSSTADLRKGLVHVHSEDVSVRTGTTTGELGLGPEQAVRSM
ncbi:hypothetical protein B0T20DRAFT_173577 [Sordaria brevicollis]|uniref:Rhodopsin domain-containing protein n=1 Tax=Sordaria brevicollis TaxID=83679 RepID=A0AAE0PHE6_SORBR|nr:hypothetical protein B0T20DRAFT_173577 [Sordaria brevicollis]